MNILHINFTLKDRETCLSYDDYCLYQKNLKEEQVKKELFTGIHALETALPESDDWILIKCGF